MSTLTDEERLHLMRVMGKDDLYFLLRYVLSTRNWKDPENESQSFWEKQWLLDRCREVQFDSDGVLNIWARYHAKSTIMTFGFSILSMLINPNITIGIFSVTKAVADSFASQIKYELETNDLLKGLYPDRFYANPQRDAPSWSLQNGFVIRRPLNLKDMTVKGYGLVDSNFTGARILHAVYDDAVNEQSVTTPDMVDKVNERWEISLNLGMPGSKRYYVGTFYAHGDSYHHMASRGVQLRLHPCYEVDYDKSQIDAVSGLPLTLVHDDKKPVLYSGEHLAAEAKLMGPSTFGVQMLCDPNAGQISGFKHEWLQWYHSAPEKVRKRCNVVITVDPAGDKKKNSSQTAIWALGLGDDGNYYVLDAVIDRLNLYERTESLFQLVAKWHPYEVRYERYSFQADIAHIRYVQEQRNFRFPITEVAGSLSKDDRIGRLVPLFANRKMYLPETLWYRESDSGKIVNLIDRWVKEEYLVFPNAMQKDGLDSMSRITEKDLPLPWPRPRDYGSTTDRWMREMRSSKYTKPKVGWMGS